MQAEELRALVQDIQHQRTEKQTVELKAGNGGFPRKIYDTLSSFSNQDSGGILIFGITDKPRYEVVGVYDAEDTQKKIMEACSQMEPKVRALITICEINGKMVVSAEIPGLPFSLRPVFYRGAGRLKGSFIRVVFRSLIIKIVYVRMPGQRIDDPVFPDPRFLIFYELLHIIHYAG